MRAGGVGSLLKRRFLERIESEKTVPEKDQVWKDSSWIGFSLKRQFLKRIHSEQIFPEKDEVWKDSSWKGSSAKRHVVHGKKFDKPIPEKKFFVAWYRSDTLNGQQISACILDLVFFLQQELTSTEGQRSIERAMSQIVASLEACGRYLETMKTFPSFMQAKESQLSSLTCQFRRHSWSLSEGSEALELLQRQAIWNETERSSLALAIVQL